MSSISSNSIKKFLEQVTRFFYDRRIVNESGARQLVESIASPGDIIAYGCETHIIKYQKVVICQSATSSLEKIFL